MEESKIWGVAAVTAVAALLILARLFWLDRRRVQSEKREAEK